MPVFILAERIKVQIAFPELSKEILDMLENFWIDENWTENRIKDSVNNAIKTCVYPKPTIANFLSWDKKVKLYTYIEMLEQKKGTEPFEFIAKDKWVLKSDLNG